jgi:hypothetical protein
VRKNKKKEGEERERERERERGLECTVTSARLCPLGSLACQRTPVAITVFCINFFRIFGYSDTNKKK